jgi:uncharacterized membrane protein YdjX (TVP38/TMEM64 family)
VLSLLTRRYGTPVWDRFVRVTAVVLLLAIPVVVWVPAAGGMVAFGLLTIWINGPIAPFLPATYEPLVILFGRVYPPLMVASVGTVGTIYAEYINYHLYQRVLQVATVERARESRLSVWVLKRFRRAPFLTIWLCSWSILPYWPVRFISPYAGYDVRRQMLATALGRFPRIWVFAMFGSLLRVDLRWLALAVLGAVVVVSVAFGLVRLRRRTGHASREVGAFGASEG